MGIREPKRMEDKVVVELFIRYTTMMTVAFPVLLFSNICICTSSANGGEKFWV